MIHRAEFVPGESVPLFELKSPVFEGIDYALESAEFAAAAFARHFPKRAAGAVLDAATARRLRPKPIDWDPAWCSGRTPPLRPAPMIPGGGFSTRRRRH